MCTVRQTTSATRNETPATPRGRRCDSKQVVSQIDQLVCVVRQAANAQAKRSGSDTEDAALAYNMQVASRRDQRVCIVRQITNAQPERSVSHIEGRRYDIRRSVSQSVR